jgi:DNA-binding NarL/FixJ family response regulator
MRNQESEGQSWGSERLTEGPRDIPLGRPRQVTQATPTCDLCAVLRHRLIYPEQHHHPALGRGPGLRIGLVDDDEDARRAAQAMVRAQHDGWALDVYNPSCRLRTPPRLTDSARRTPVQTGQGSAALPDIFLVGATNPDPSSLACVRAFKALAPGLPVMVLSSRSDAASIVQWYMAGAAGFLPKPVTRGDLARAIRLLAKGLPVLCEEGQKALMDLAHQAGAIGASQGLSRREQDVVVCVAAKLHDNEICQRLEMTPNNLHVTLFHIFKKLGVHSRRQAASKLLGGQGA